MAKETQKAKIERLEKELNSAHEVIQKLNDEISVMHDNADKNFNNSADYVQMKKHIEEIEDKLKALNDSVKHNRKMYENEIKTNEKLNNEIRKLKEKKYRTPNYENLEIIDKQLDQARENSDKWHQEFFNEQQKNKRLEEEIQKLKNERPKKSSNKLIQENKELKEKIEVQKNTIKEFYSDKMKAEEKVNQVKLQQNKIVEAYKKDLEKVKEEYKGKSENNIKHNERGAGRKARFTNEQIETIKLYRLQGKTIKEISSIFKCSVGLIHKIINEK